MTEAARLPLAFAQVREDPELDRWVVEQLDGAEVLMVASGGCTAAALAAMPRVARLHLVDPNPAQIALSRLKLWWLSTITTSERLRLLGHEPMPVAQRRQELSNELEELDLPADAMGPLDFIAKHGPDYSGRYEVLFRHLRGALRELGGELMQLLQLNDPKEQTRRADGSTKLGHALDAAFDSVMALPNLEGLFGAAATRNRFEPFARHFDRRTRDALAAFPAADNPWLWQMLGGKFPKGKVYPWLEAPPAERMPEVTWRITTMREALRDKTDAYDFVHLSNILDWLDPEEARSTLELAWNALRPGGWTVIRQLNSALDIPSMGDQFAWKTTAAKSWHSRDRSFFYRGIFLGKKQ